MCYRMRNIHLWQNFSCRNFSILTEHGSFHKGFLAHKEKLKALLKHRGCEKFGFFITTVGLPGGYYKWQVPMHSARCIYFDKGRSFPPENSAPKLWLTLMMMLVQFTHWASFLPVSSFRLFSSRINIPYVSTQTKLAPVIVKSSIFLVNS